MGAVAAVGAGGGYAFAFGPAGEDYVEEAAEGKAEEGGEDCAEGLDLVEDGWLLLWKTSGAKAPSNFLHLMPRLKPWLTSMPECAWVGRIGHRGRLQYFYGAYGRSRFVGGECGGYGFC